MVAKKKEKPVVLTREQLVRILDTVFSNVLSMDKVVAGHHRKITKAELSEYRDTVLESYKRRKVF